MERAAFAKWENRIAPVFDAARTVRLVESESGAIIGEKEVVLPETQPIRRVSRLVELGAETLVCGAVSRPVHAMAAAYGIRVFPFVSGSLQEVVKAWLEGRLGERRYSMPGCFGRGRGWLGEQNSGKEISMTDQFENSGSGRGQGRGRGGGMGRNRGGGMGRGMQPGASDTCVCPNCGHRETHKRGVPCNEMKCPECGNAMIRG